METYLRESLAGLTSPEGYLYAGLPKFRRLFGRDSLISAMQMLHENPAIARGTLKSLSLLQGKNTVYSTGEEKGKILHEDLSSASRDVLEHMKRVPWLKEGLINYFSVDSTPLFLILASRYLEKTGDSRFIQSISGNLNDALNWILDNGVSNGALVYHKAKQGMGLQSQSWRDGIGSILELAKDPVAVVGVQGYLIEAIDAVAKLSGEVGFDHKGEELSGLRSSVIRVLEDFFYIEDIDYFALAIDGDGVAISKITSDPGHLLNSGALSRHYNERIVDRIMQEDMMTEFGIRSLSSDDPQFDDRAYQRGSVWPHDNWMIAMGMKKLGYTKQYHAIRDSMIRAYEELGTLPEYYGVDRFGKMIPVEKLRVAPCEPQAWSACALLNFIGVD